MIAQEYAQILYQQQQSTQLINQQNIVQPQISPQISQQSISQNNQYIDSNQFSRAYGTPPVQNNNLGILPPTLPPTLPPVDMSP